MLAKIFTLACCIAVVFWATIRRMEFHSVQNSDYSKLCSANHFARQFCLVVSIFKQYNGFSLSENGEVWLLVKKNVACPRIILPRLVSPVRLIILLEVQYPFL